MDYKLARGLTRSLLEETNFEKSSDLFLDLVRKLAGIYDSPVNSEKSFREAESEIRTFLEKNSRCIFQKETSKKSVLQKNIFFVELISNRVPIDKKGEQFTVDQFDFLANVITITRKSIAFKERTLRIGITAHAIRRFYERAKKNDDYDISSHLLQTWINGRLFTDCFQRSDSYLPIILPVSDGLLFGRTVGYSGDYFGFTTTTVRNGSIDAQDKHIARLRQGGDVLGQGGIEINTFVDLEGLYELQTEYILKFCELLNGHMKLILNMSVATSFVDMAEITPPLGDQTITKEDDPDGTLMPKLIPQVIEEFSSLLTSPTAMELYKYGQNHI